MAASKLIDSLSDFVRVVPEALRDAVRICEVVPGLWVVTMLLGSACEWRCELGLAYIRCMLLRLQYGRGVHIWLSS